jgi:hypothetical protein
LGWYATVVAQEAAAAAWRSRCIGLLLIMATMLLLRLLRLVVTTASLSCSRLWLLFIWNMAFVLALWGRRTSPWLVFVTAFSSLFCNSTASMLLLLLLFIDVALLLAAKGGDGENDDDAVLPVAWMFVVVLVQGQ